MLRIAFRAAGRDRLMLVTDAMPTVGANLSHFNLFGRAIALECTRLTAEDGTLAGAHLDMMGAVRGAVSLMRVSLETHWLWHRARQPGFWVSVICSV